MAIISNPRVYEKLQQDIEQVVFQYLVSTPIQDLEATRLPHLQAGILESLRKNHLAVHHPNEWFLQRVILSILGYRDPGGTFIRFNDRGTQLNAVFGDEPAECRPRWLIEDQNRLQVMGQDHDLIVGHGSSKCLGIRVVTIEYSNCTSLSFE